MNFISSLRSVHWLMSLLNMLGAIWVVMIMMLITADVVGRAFFNSPVFGVPEIVKVSVVGLVWCMMAHTLKIGAHLRSTIFLDRMCPYLKRGVEMLSCLMGFAIFSLIVYSGWSNMIEAWQIGEFVGEHPVRVPTAPIRTLVLIGAALTSVQFLVMLLEQYLGKKFIPDKEEY